MIICHWKSFSTDTETYTLDVFEQSVGDKFEAMMVKDSDSIPTVIWTNNHVIIVRKISRITNEIYFEKISRNPVCE